MTYIRRSIKNAVRDRAGDRCEYCHTPQAYRPYTFQIEHIRAIKHGGSSDLTNLALACTWCNLRKGSDIATYDGLTDQLVPLYNPRTQNWDDHFKIDGSVLRGKTSIGTATIQILQLNHPDQVETRRILLETGSWD